MDDRVQGQHLEEEAAAGGGMPLVGGLAFEVNASHVSEAEDAPASGSDELAVEEPQPQLEVAVERGVAPEAILAVPADVLAAADVGGPVPGVIAPDAAPADARGELGGPSGQIAAQAAVESVEIGRGVPGFRVVEALSLETEAAGHRLHVGTEEVAGRDVGRLA